MNNLLSFLNELENRKIQYKINKVRNDFIMVEVAVPGQRWEIEFGENGNIEIEKFISDGKIYGEKEIDELFSKFSD